MRLSQPRIAPMSDAEMGPEQKEALKDFGDGPLLNIFRTLARAPKALSRFNAWGGYVLSRRNDLPAREREIVILRIGYLCRSGYEFTQHTRIGLNSGLSADEIEKIKRGADAGWSDADAALIRASDELHADQFITEPTWTELRRHFSEKQAMDVVFTAGQYTQVSMMLNTFGVQLDAGQTLDPELKAY
ncbi:carboxymuconolactone decarboxylase family protein [Phenylobacterium sp. J367]|uniref:carboxymuconolactone decarboxylase family protein n=1 Tax=Phenylobacterium sp. J367 TaxID=2898435 RepID=UPI002150B07B|nr:carboxymuconolactone decarboxylase family protein [Phenylobacterium sp. J367]MCR5877341.1 carboxymuconolactone decarboxylase family protein [Phenylobacterium sp. J367]